MYVFKNYKEFTQNEEPIVIDCYGTDEVGRTKFDRCGIRFLHREGNYIATKLWRKNIKESQYEQALNNALQYYNTIKKDR